MADENTISKSQKAPNKRNELKKKESHKNKEHLNQIVLCDGGVKKKIIREGEGGKIPPKYAKVKVHYTATLESDNSKFDSSRDRGEPVEFDLGVGSVIKGWDHGVATMKVGERALLTIRDDFAYGKQGNEPAIPPSATLIFDIELLSFKEKEENVTKDGGVIKKIRVKGEGYLNPDDTAKCIVKYIGTANGKVFTTHNTEEEVELNIDEDFKMVEGLSCALQNMTKGEKAIFLVKSSYGYGSQGNDELGIPPDTDLVYTIELISFEKDKNSWDMDTKEKIALMMKRKAKGNTYYQMKLYSKSASFFEKAVSLFPYNQMKDLSYGEKTTILTTLLACHSNTALCKLKMKEWYEAIESCDKALDIKPNHVKCLFRRGQAKSNFGNNNAALADLRRAQELKPTDKAIHNLIITVRKRGRKQKKKEKQKFAGIFEKTVLAEETPITKVDEEKKLVKVAYNGGVGIRKEPVYPGNKYRIGETISKETIVEWSEKKTVAYKGNPITFFKLADNRGWIHNYNPKEPLALDAVEIVEELSLEVGDCVILQDLKKNASLNGKEAIIIKIGEKDKYDIKFDDDDVQSNIAGKYLKKERIDSGGFTSTTKKLLQQYPPACNDPDSWLADRIDDCVFLGNNRSSGDTEQLIRLGITHILNVCAVAKYNETGTNIPKGYRSFAKAYMGIAAENTNQYPINNDFPQSISFIRQARESGGKVLVHCQTGVSQSATIVIAYLMKKQGLSLKEAYFYVSRQRPIINPITGFKQKLQNYEKELIQQRRRP